jgi:ABC-2 type transport system permease protein
VVRGKLQVILRREYRERVFTRWFVFATVFGPIVFGALLFLPSYFASRRTASADVARIVVLDATGTTLGRRVAAELNGGPAGDSSLTRVRVVADTAALPAAEREAADGVRAGRFRGYLVLDDRSLAGVSARYVGTNVTSLVDMQSLESTVRREVLGERLEAAGLTPGEAARLKGLRLELDAQRLGEGAGTAGSGRLNILFALGVALLLYLTIFLYGQSVLRGVMEEKQSRVAEVVISSVSPTTLLAGKVIGVAAVGLTQLCIWGALGWAMLQVRVAVLRAFGIASLPVILPHISLSALLLLVCFFVLGYLFYAALFAVIGAIVSTEQEAQQAQLPVAMFLVLSIAFVQSVVAEPNGGLAVALGMIPFSAPILMPLRMSVTTVPTWQVVVSLVELALGCWVVVGLSARVYRVGLLMYGKRPRIRELLRWIRVA